MTITLELPPDIEAGLAAQAEANGLALPQYLEQMLRERLPRLAGTALSASERAEAWRDAAKGLPHTSPLSDEAISRENLYAARG